MELDKLPRDMIEQSKVNHNVFFQAMFDENNKGWNDKNILSTFQNHEDIELLFKLVNIDYQNKGQSSLIKSYFINEKALRLSLEKVYSSLSESDGKLNELLGMLDKSIFSDRLIKLKDELALECFSSIRDEIDLYLIGKNQKGQLQDSNFLGKIAKSFSIASSHLMSKVGVEEGEK
ncbi:hypothetical protein [Paenibacillus polysaccharolyticus]|nr:hypothetical protein [Paenibacillus polysaccharolyticus]